MAEFGSGAKNEGRLRPSWEWMGSAALRELLAAGEDPDGKDFFGLPWAARAAIEGDLESLESLALAGANLDAFDSDGKTPVCLAIEKFQPKAVKALLALGASAEGAPGSQPPLALAAELGLHEAVEALLSAGADPNRQNKDRVEPILLATMALDARSVRALAIAGAEIGARLDAGEGSLGYDCVGLIVRSLGAGNSNVEGALETIQALLECGADPNSRWGQCGWRSLNVCCGRKELGSVIRALVKAGADPELRDDSGANAREAASAGRTLDLLEGALSEIEYSALYEASWSSPPSPKRRL